MGVCKMGRRKAMLIWAKIIYKAYKVICVGQTGGVWSKESA